MKTWIAGWVAATAMSCGVESSCVATGTRVSTPTGPRRVEDFAVGDALFTVDPLNGAFAITHVTHIRTSERECGSLTVGGAAFTVTSDHPLFDPITGSFHAAGDWLTGSRSRLLAFDGERTFPVEVAHRESFARISQVFDLTVAHAWHTFVAEGVVVHNKSKALPGCEVPDAGLVSGGAIGGSCSCADGGTGVWLCGGAGGSATCQRCGQSLADGGSAGDAGP